MDRDGKLIRGAAQHVDDAVGRSPPRPQPGEIGQLRAKRCELLSDRSDRRDEIGRSLKDSILALGASLTSRRNEDGDGTARGTDDRANERHNSDQPYIHLISNLDRVDMTRIHRFLHGSERDTLALACGVANVEGVRDHAVPFLGGVLVNESGARRAVPKPAHHVLDCAAFLRQRARCVPQIVKRMPVNLAAVSVGTHTQA
jgi:hypothetical protein